MAPKITPDSSFQTPSFFFNLWEVSCTKEVKEAMYWLYDFSSPTEDSNDSNDWVRQSALSFDILSEKLHKERDFWPEVQEIYFRPSFNQSQSEGHVLNAQNFVSTLVAEINAFYENKVPIAGSILTDWPFIQFRVQRRRGQQNDRQISSCMLEIRLLVYHAIGLVPQLTSVLCLSTSSRNRRCLRRETGLLKLLPTARIPAIGSLLLVTSPAKVMFDTSSSAVKQTKTIGRL